MMIKDGGTVYSYDKEPNYRYNWLHIDTGSGGVRAIYVRGDIEKLLTKWSHSGWVYYMPEEL